MVMHGHAQAVENCGHTVSSARSHNRAAQTGVFDLGICISNRPFIDVGKALADATGLNSRKVEKRINVSGSSLMVVRTGSSTLKKGAGTNRGSMIGWTSVKFGEGCSTGLQGLAPTRCGCVNISCVDSLGAFSVF
jgi:hypothetical protein